MVIDLQPTRKRVEVVQPPPIVVMSRRARLAATYHRDGRLVYCQPHKPLRATA